MNDYRPTHVLLILGILITDIGFMFVSDERGWTFAYGFALLNAIFASGWIVAFGIPILWKSYKKHLNISECK
jgi:hypothetical protein